MRRRPMNQDERSAYYGRTIDPVPPPSLEATRDAHGRKAETTDDQQTRESRKKTIPGPKSRGRGPRGRLDEGPSVP
jgi:hypothetical protein